MTRIEWRGEAAKSVVHEAAAEGVAAVAHRMLADSQVNVPKETGALLRSGQVVIDADGLGAEISYGHGLDDPRAVIVHEKLDLQHVTGKPKYLESALTAAGATAGARIAAELRKRLA